MPLNEDELRKVYFFTLLEGVDWDSNVSSSGQFIRDEVEGGFQTFKAAYSPKVLQALGEVLACNSEIKEEVNDARLDMDSNFTSDGQQRNVVRKVEVGQSLGERKHQETSNIQSQGKFVLRLEGIDEYGPILGWNQHWTVFPVGTEFYTAPPTAPQLAAQALERAASLISIEAIGFPGPVVVLIHELAEKVRALIDQPVEQVKKRYNPSGSLSEYGVFPECDAQPVEQGGDELVERFLSQDDQGVFVDFYMQCEDSDADGYTASKEDMRRLAELGVVRSLGFGRYEVTSFGDWLFQGIFKQKPSLPLKTVDEFNAERYAIRSLHAIKEQS